MTLCRAVPLQAERSPLGAGDLVGRGGKGAASRGGHRAAVYPPPTPRGIGRAALLWPPGWGQCWGHADGRCPNGSPEPGL